jgi:RNA polymerase sigma factor (sigma-70 family)
MTTAPVLSQLRRFALHQRGRASDGDLLERFLARRDDAAFEELVRRHGPMVLGVCRRALADPHDADDAFQATFLILARRASSIAPASRVGPWLYGVARRVSLKARAAIQRRRSVERGAALDRPGSPPETPDDLRPLIDEELGRLPEKYRAPLVLCVLQERPRKEAAAALGWTEGTLSGRLARARAMLGDRLRRRGVEPAGLALLAEVPPRLAQAAASPAAVALTEEVIRTMVMTKLKAVVGVLALVAGVGFGAGAMAYRPAPAATPKAEKAATKPDKKAERPPYLIEPPDLVTIEPGLPEGNTWLVRPDGTISLGSTGTVHVAGLTVDQAKRAIADHVAPKIAGFDRAKFNIRVMNYSKFYYVITEDGGGEHVARVPCSGNETVLDAIGGYQERSAVALKKIWIARATPNGGPTTILPVDWHGITQRGAAATNYQLFPGDRVYVKGAGPKEADNPDPVSELEAAVKALREARSFDEQRRAFDALDAATKRLREQRKKP